MYFHTEPQVCKPAAGFQSVSEALEILKLKKENFVCNSDKLQSQIGTGASQLYLCRNCEFTENMRSEFPSTNQEMTEDFKKFSPEHEECE